MSSARQFQENTEADLQAIKWGGWSIISIVFLGWAGWLSLLAIGTQSAVVKQEERQINHFEQLREDIHEVKAEVVALRKSSGAPLSVSHQ